MIILDLKSNDFNRDIIIKYAQISKNICCKIYDLTLANWFKDNEIKFYYGYPINSYYDLQGLIDLEVEYIIITAPLTFDMNYLKSKNIKFRMVPNVAYDVYIPRKNGIHGQWVRPEDVKYYEKGIYIFDFENANLEQERTLYHIYAEQGNWPGNLNILLTNFDTHVDNRILPEEIGEIRSNCRQRCMSGGKCHYCETAIKFEQTVKKYHEKKKKEIETNEEN